MLLNVEQGMLTPDEFVQAGDHLIRTCPTWKWESGEASKRRPYLPADKQFLSTTGVPCYRRVNDLESANYVDRMIEAEGGDDWCAPELVSLGVEAEDGDLSIIGEEDTGAIKAAVPLPASKISAAKAAADDDYLDMEDESLALDENVDVSKIKISDESAVIKSRRYDVSITYDNYYRTPRIWLFGYNENGSPLSPEEIFQVHLPLSRSRCYL
jgi:ubiquitin-like-conjugating enzyme ATG3